MDNSDSLLNILGRTGSTLYRCEPVYWKSYPKSVRKVLAWITIVIFSFSFLLPVICVVFLIPAVWKYAPIFSSLSVGLLVFSLILPMKEWLVIRKIGQLWYEVFQFSSNLSPIDLKKVIEYGDKKQLIIGMHPHGIVPFQAILWSAYCDQYMTDQTSGKGLYGFGAAADVVMYLPLLRNIMGWLSAGSASYKALKDGLLKGKAPAANAAGRTPKNLYILPGGVAEVFTSTPGKHVIIFKKRRGLVKLSIETGAEIVPCYVFGGTDFFNNLATHGGIFSALSRKLRAGITIFWGPYGLPIPFAPRVTMVIGDAITVPKTWDSTKDGPIPAEMIEELHNRFLKSMVALFDKYKAAAGYPDAVLEVQ